MAFVIDHALVFTALPLLVGLVLAFHRRFHDLGLIAVQRFRFDIVPLALLLAIAITGLALTADSTFFGGTYYWFVSLTHEAVVVLWLISLPFGKFFHIIERPATVGIELYWRTGEDSTQATCAALRRSLRARALHPGLEAHDLRYRTELRHRARGARRRRPARRVRMPSNRLVAGFLPHLQAHSARRGESRRAGS